MLSDFGASLWVPACAGTTGFQSVDESNPTRTAHPKRHPRAGGDPGSAYAAIARANWVPACAGTTCLEFRRIEPDPHRTPHPKRHPRAGGDPGSACAAIARANWVPACAGTTYLEFRRIEPDPHRTPHAERHPRAGGDPGSACAAIARASGFPPAQILCSSSLGKRQIHIEGLARFEDTNHPVHQLAHDGNDGHFLVLASRNHACR